MLHSSPYCMIYSQHPLSTVRQIVSCHARPTGWHMICPLSYWTVLGIKYVHINNRDDFDFARSHCQWGGITRCKRSCVTYNTSSLALLFFCLFILKLALLRFTRFFHRPRPLSSTKCQSKPLCSWQLSSDWTTVVQQQQWFIESWPCRSCSFLSVEIWYILLWVSMPVSVLGGCSFTWWYRTNGDGEKKHSR